MKSGNMLLKYIAGFKEVFVAVQIHGYLSGGIRTRQRQKGSKRYNW